MIPALAVAARNISAAVALEFPSLAPDKNKFSPVGSLGNIKSAAIPNMPSNTTPIL